MVHLEFHASYNHVIFKTLFHFDVSYETMARAAQDPFQILSQIFRPKPKKPPVNGFEAKNTKLS